MFKMCRDLAAATALASALAGCALQPAATTPLPALRAQWEGQPATPTAETLRDDPLQSAWWKALNDPALDAMADAALQTSPTLARAVARVAEARAGTDAQAAAAQPAVRATAQAGRGTTTSATGAAQTSASLTQSLSWELDLFGRLRHDRAAAEQRLLGTSAEARATRLSLQAQVADGVVAARACLAQAATRRDDVTSRRVALRTMELRQAAGLQSAVDAARSRSTLADAETNRAAADAQCTELMLQLATLTGWSAGRVRQVLATTAAPAASASHGGTAVPIPPAFRAAQPATVLAHHPSIVAALRSADAAWEDTGAAMAARRPSLSLSALLSSTWLRAAGGVLHSTGWSLAPELGASLWDGGRSRAQADAARARHDQALAALDSAVRTAVQEVELALAQAASAEEREVLARDGTAAASELLRASAASHAAGRMGLFELEDARRSLNDAQLSLIGAQRDRARAWVALVRANGNVSAGATAFNAPVTRSP